MNDRRLKLTVLAIAVLSSFLTPFMGSSVVIALPQIALDLQMNTVQLGWVSMAYLLAAAMFLVPIGRLADIYGRRKVFAVGILINTLTAIALATVNSPTVLISLRFAQGIGAAMIFGTGMAMLTSVYGEGERGQALGITAAAVYLGLSIGPLAGGWLTQLFGWRSVFLAHAPIALVVLALTVYGLKKEWKIARGQRFDTVGSLFYALAVALFMDGLTRLSSRVGLIMLASGTLGLIIFIVWESKTALPILEVSLFRHNTVFAFSNLAALINYSATFSVGFLLSLYLQYVKQLTPFSAGLILLWQPVVQTIFSPMAGRLSDIIQPRVVTSLGMGLSVLVLFRLGFVSEASSPACIIMCLMMLGLSFALFSSPNTNAVMSSVDPQRYGVAAATLGTMRLIGQMLSMGMVMLFFALYGLEQKQIRADNLPQFVASVRVTFFTFAMLCCFGVLASLARGKLSSRN